MGQLNPNKYHISDDGKVYKINEDGSFISVGNIEDIEKKPSGNPVNNIPPIPSTSKSTSSLVEVGWWKRNYNWLWITILIVFIGWFISCLSCAWPYYPIYDGSGSLNYYQADNTEEIFGVSLIILFCYCLSWYLSAKNKTWIKLIQILLVGCADCIAMPIYCLCEQAYSFLLLFLATIPFSLWIVAICLSVFKRK